MPSCKYCKVFENTYFEEHLRTAVSAYCLKTYLEPFQTWCRFLVNGFQALFSIFLTLSRSLLLPDIFYLFLWLTKYKINLVARICELQHILYLKYGNVIKSAQNGVAAFNYFLLLKFYWFINKVISVMLCL